MEHEHSDKKIGFTKLMKDLGLPDQEMNEEQFNKMVSLLDPKQEQVLRERYGIPKPSRPKSEGVEITAQHIREIEREALRKLRSRK